MQLNKEEKAHLRTLVNSMGFSILERIYEDKKSNLLSEFMTADLGQDATRHKIYGTQNFVIGMESLLNTAKGLTAEKTSKIESLR